MRSDPFIERLEQLMDGELEAEEVLRPLVDGLTNLLNDFEESLDHQPDELVETLEEHLEIIADGVQDCLDLAHEILAEGGDEESLMTLAYSHRQLNASLLDFHNASWIFRGPTNVPWVNMAVASGERFLQGEPLEPGLSFMLDQQAKELSDRLRVTPCMEGQAVISAVERLSSWAGGATTATREELEDMLTILIGRVEAAQHFLEQKRLSLEELIQVLQEETDVDTLLDHLEMTRQELKPLLERVEVATLSSSVTTSEAAKKAMATLQAIYQTIYDIAEAVQQAEEVEEVDLAEPLLDLYDELQNRMQALQVAANAEGTAACPSCGTRNSRQARRCSSCSRVLAAMAGIDSSQLDFTEGQSAQQTAEEENVHRLRVACASFQQGTMSLEEFQGHVSDLSKLLDRARRGFQEPNRTSLPPHGLLFWEALDQIGEALDCLTVIELSADKSLDYGLQTFMEGVKKMRIAQERSVSTT